MEGFVRGPWKEYLERAFRSGSSKYLRQSSMEWFYGKSLCKECMQDMFRRGEGEEFMEGTEGTHV